MYCRCKLEKVSSCITVETSKIPSGRVATLCSGHTPVWVGRNGCACFDAGHACIVIHINMLPTTRIISCYRCKTCCKCTCHDKELICAWKKGGSIGH